MWERLVTWWDRQDDILTLRGLDDRMLEDMGLTRAEIWARVMAERADRAEARPAPDKPCGPPAVAC